MTTQATKIPKGWKETTLSEVADVNDLTVDRNYNFDEIEYIDVASVEERNLLQTQKLKLEDAPSRAKRIVKDNNILISTVRPNLRHYCFIKKAKPNLVASTGFAVIDAKENKSDAYFLYNLLTTNEYTQYLTKISDTQTSTYPAFNSSVISNSKFLLPPLPEQRAIAGVFLSLDNKIELLRDQNKTLEATAQAIFKERFDKKKGKLPEGWKVGKIKDLIDILSGFAFSSADFDQNGNYKLVTIKNVQDRSFDPETKSRLSELPEKMPQYCRLQSGDILLSLTGNVGRACLVSGEDFLLNQRVAKIHAKNSVDYGYSYLLFLQNTVFSLLQNIASGTAQQNLSPVQTKEIEIIIPTRQALNEFGAVANKLIHKINCNNSQIQILSKLRDTILPKLIRGEVRVKEFSQ